MENKKCANCIWGDVCDGSDGCDFFHTTRIEDEEEALADEYRDDLDERHSLYMELLEEQNG